LGESFELSYCRNCEHYRGNQAALDREVGKVLAWAEDIVEQSVGDLPKDSYQQ
jgi:hypothetical protein